MADKKKHKKITVLIVDDSALVRQLLTDMIGQDDELEVAGIARDGVEAIKLTQELDPDVITMDIHMPEMDGLQALEYIMKKSPRPVVMLSALVKQGAAPTLRALELGAVDFIAKPSQFPTSVSEIREDVLAKIKAAAGSRAREVWERARKAKAPRKVKPRKEAAGGSLVVMGASAGGPRALAEVVPALPEDLQATMVVVQHMPEPFTGSFAERLNSRSRVEVREAEEGEELVEGRALVVPGGHDMVVERSAAGRVTARLLPTVARHGASPVIDVTMESAAQVFGARAVGVLLSGMGSDGAMGLGMIRDAGGYTIAQNEETCLVFGMPKAAIERRLVTEILPIDRIAEAIAARV
ncbi:MAG: chemotaxis response regulator protein-glutamate methylesterase [Actinobacteria bacterium]|nr:chemotaxis response regulator protein-glutamate methylesterase [Actinomycetota bacterium]MBU1943579.1 chemotaxis response regulator protein-glutamate methylesterase [Actinomycetota bacterium]MBU2688913.1 chemotaxis response regulator protein-glutamate methylesterase [Actinomycetota bacterium]